MPDRRATVCLPTYNERENLEPMLRALGAHGVRVLVIDDNSPDGTGQLAERFAHELDYVDVLHRPRKEGLGPAYLAGFRRALADGAERILEMDCDFSHDPNDVPRLIAVTDEADLALGSRYVEGGEVGNWGATRRAVSAAGSLYARVLLSVPIRDLTGGFKCYRRTVLETIDLDAIQADPRRARARARAGSRIRQAEHRREHRNRVSLQRPLDPDDDPVRGWEPAGDRDRRTAARPLRAGVGTLARS